MPQVIPLQPMNTINYSGIQLVELVRSCVKIISASAENLHSVLPFVETVDVAPVERIIDVLSFLRILTESEENKNLIVKSDIVLDPFESLSSFFDLFATLYAHFDKANGELISWIKFTLQIIEISLNILQNIFGIRFILFLYNYFR